MTEAGYARILLDKKDTQIMELESQITKLRIEYERQIVKLQKENAELKDKLKPENCLKLLAKEGYIKFSSEQLTKAEVGK